MRLNTNYQGAKHCKTWIIGKWTTPRQQSWAPRGTHFHQFVVPPILSFRRVCTYGKLAVMKLPQDVKGLGSCEDELERGAVRACQAEVGATTRLGAIDVDQMDDAWNAALKHGLRPT